MPLINRIGVAAAVLQEKTITETIYNETEITPDEDIDGISKFTIAAQPVYEIKTITQRSSESAFIISGLKREPKRVIGVLLMPIQYSLNGIYEFDANKDSVAWSGTALAVNTGNSYNTVEMDLSVTYNETDKSLTLTRKTTGVGWNKAETGYTVCVFY